MCFQCKDPHKNIGGRKSRENYVIEGKVCGSAQSHLPEHCLSESKSNFFFKSYDLVLLHSNHMTFKRVIEFRHKINTWPIYRNTDW